MRLKMSLVKRVPTHTRQVGPASSAIAKALLAGGNQAKVFAAGLQAAVQAGGCNAANNILRSEQPWPAATPRARVALNAC
jgi:hypothetical protein